MIGFKDDEIVSYESRREYGKHPYCKGSYVICCYGKDKGSLLVGLQLLRPNAKGVNASWDTTSCSTNGP